MRPCWRTDGAVDSDAPEYVSGGLDNDHGYLICHVQNQSCTGFIYRGSGWRQCGVQCVSQSLSDSVSDSDSGHSRVAMALFITVIQYTLILFDFFCRLHCSLGVPPKQDINKFNSNIH